MSPCASGEGPVRVVDAIRPRAERLRPDNCGQACSRLVPMQAAISVPAGRGGRDRCGADPLAALGRVAGRFFPVLDPAEPQGLAWPCLGTGGAGAARAGRDTGAGARPLSACAPNQAPSRKAPPQGLPRSNPSRKAGPAEERGPVGSGAPRPQGPARARHRSMAATRPAAPIARCAQAPTGTHPPPRSAGRDPWQRKRAKAGSSQAMPAGSRSGRVGS
ncbi:hypothetical protein SAMN05421759_102209 [Roseivivax lentus]|uniref:Uncharacterized protein n=1 Tax=Roseivivax lentus TaxID=633194 RepID=A0A1N7KYZ6_9RHOB|nr:hypothetical protein SAMN05421759_102209 [Roseivivax lentus]